MEEEAEGLSDLERASELWERTETIWGKFKEAKENFQEISELVEQIFGWGHEDDTAQKEIDALDALSVKIDAVLSDVSQANLNPLRELIANIEQNFETLASRVKSFDKASQGFSGIAGSNYLDWYFNGNKLDPIAGQDIAFQTVFGGTNWPSLSQILSRSFSIGGGSSFFSQIDQAVKAATGSEASLDAGSAFNGRSRYDVYEALYFRLLRLYRTGHYLHDAVLTQFCALIYDPGITLHCDGDSKTKIAALKAKAPDPAAYLANYGFEARFAAVSSNLEWEGLIHQPMFQMENTWDEDSTYDPWTNLPAACALETQPEPDALQLSYDPVICDDPNGFITGLKMTYFTKSKSYSGQNSAVERVDVTGYAYIQAHFARLDAKGQFQALGWYPSEPPSFDTSKSFTSVRVNAFDTSALCADLLKDAKATTDRLLVMTKIAFSDSGNGYDGFFGLTGQFAKLAIQSDGSGIIEAFDPSIPSLLASPVNAVNHLRLDLGHMSGIVTSPVARMKATEDPQTAVSYAPDPAGLVTNVYVSRRNDSQRGPLYLSVQVASRRRALPCNQVVPPPPPPAPVTFADGDLVATGETCFAVPEPGFVDTDTPTFQLYQMYVNGGRAWVIGSVDAGMQRPGGGAWTKRTDVGYGALQHLLMQPPVIAEGTLITVINDHNDRHAVYRFNGGQLQTLPMTRDLFDACRQGNVVGLPADVGNELLISFPIIPANN